MTRTGRYGAAGVLLAVGALAAPGGTDAAQAPQDSAQRQEVGPGLTAARVELSPAGAASIDLERVEGPLPALVEVLDGAGVPVAWTVRQRTDRRLRLAPIAAGPDGVLDLVLAGRGDVTSTVKITTRAIEDPGGAWDQPLPDAAMSPWAPGRLVLSTPGGGDPAHAADFVQAMGFDVLAAPGEFVVAGMPDGRSGSELLDALYLAMHCGGGIVIEPDAWAEPPEGSQANVIVVGSSFGRSYPTQAALRMVGVPAARRLADGTGVVVAVLDTGLDVAHPLFAGRMLPGRDFVDDDEDPSEERDGFDDDGDGAADESYGHGTFVAGVALAVAPGATILPVRVLDAEGRGTASGVAAGLYFAVESGARVVNLSLGTRAYAPVLAEAVAFAVSQGVVVAVAAGNDGDRRSVDFPGSEAGVLSVSALAADGHRAGFANGRRRTAVFAPGTRIVGPYPGGTWGLASGTSFATPLVSGAAALLFDLDETARPEEARDRLTVNARLELRRLAR